MRSLGLLVLGAVWSSLASAQLTPLPRRSAPAVDRLLAAVEAAYRRKETDRFVSLFTDDFTQIDVNRRIEIRGTADWRSQTERVNSAHLEMSRVHHGRVVQGDLVLAEIEWSGTVRGAEFGPEANDRSYRFGGFGVLELSAGKIRRQVLFIDYATYRDQLVSPARTATERRDTAPPGRLIDIGGRRMHLHCLGRGRPTVVVDQGAGAWSVHWMHLHDDLARKSRACLFDRAGLGWSDPAPGPATSAQAADDLARLLDAAGEPAPFVLVGHSYGGYNARVFRAKHPDRVSGIVLVESGHEDQWTRLPPPLTELTRGAVGGLRELAAALRQGKDVPVQPVDSAFRDPRQRRLLEAAYRTPLPYEELADVIEAMDSATAQTRRSGSLGDLPLVVITARRSFDAFRHLPISIEASNQVWYRLQGELAGLSTCALHLWSESGDHNLQLTDPAVVIAGLGAMVEALSRDNGRRCRLADGD